MEEEDEDEGAAPFVFGDVDEDVLLSSSSSLVVLIIFSLLLEKGSWFLDEPVAVVVLLLVLLMVLGSAKMAQNPSCGSIANPLNPAASGRMRDNRFFLSLSSSIPMASCNHSGLSNSAKEKET